jgi:DNA-binding NarL/FixJ family response regulator
MENPHVLIVDDREIARDGLKALIREYVPECVITEVSDYDTMMAVLRQGRYTHLIIDPGIAGGKLRERFPQVRKEFPELYILGHTLPPGAGDVGWLLSKGADGYVSAEAGSGEVIAVLCRRRERSREGAENPFLSLSPREQQMARHMLNGDTSKEIQNALRLKSSTVSTMKGRIFRKLKVSNLVGLLKLAEYCHFR